MSDLLIHGWTLFYTVFLALFLFGVTVFVHELGHFIVARRCGLVVKAFSIGFGHALFKREHNGVVYKIGWIPFGGYVSLPQLDPEGMEKLQGEHPEEPLPDASPWQKIAVAFSGPVGNLILAVLLALAIWLIPGGEAGASVRPLVGRIDAGSEAYAAGLREGDELLAVNGATIKSWYEFSVETLLQNLDRVALDVRRGGEALTLEIPLTRNDDGTRAMDGVQPAVPCLFGAVTAESPAARAGVRRGDLAVLFDGHPVIGWEHFTTLVQAASPGHPVVMTVDRDGQMIELTVIPEYHAEHNRILIGVQLGGSGLPWMFYKKPLDQLKYDALAIVRVLRALVTPAEARQAAGGLGGPLAIFGMLTFSIRMGLLNTLGLIRFLNVNLAVLNLLPIPVLDGGHILFSLWHGLTRRPVHAKVQAALVNVFAILLIGAMLLLTWKDIDRTTGWTRRLERARAERVEPIPAGEQGLP